MRMYLHVLMEWNVSAYAILTYSDVVRTFGAYAAVIPLFVKKLMAHESPVINGDGEYSRDFTYIDNVIQMNMLAMTTTNPDAVNQVYNTAFGERTTLNQLVNYLKEYLSEFDPKIADVEILHGPNRRVIYLILWLALIRLENFLVIFRNTACATV